MRGVVLVFVAGLLALLLLAALAFLSLAAAGAKCVPLERTRAAIAATSGMEYAAARLWARSEPVDASERDPANRGDDWTLRLGPASQGPRSGQAFNPSYSHGESWTDNLSHLADSVDNDADGSIDEAGEGMGAYTAGDTEGPDLDGDGAFTAWTGRLRGGPGPARTRFSLRVASSEELACVNSGELGSPLADHDLDGFLNRDDAYDPVANSAGYREDADANDVPDWRDSRFSGNVHIVNLLNNLGAVLSLSTTRVELYVEGVPQLGGMETSDLGLRIVSERPRGGYRALAQVERALEAAGFAAADVARVRPFLTTQGTPVPVSLPLPDKENAYGDFITQPEARYEFHVRPDLNRAPIGLLRSALRYLTASGTYWRDFSNTRQLESPFVRLGRDEADRVAAQIDGARPFLSWRKLLEVLAASPDPPDPAALFEEDLFLSGGDRVCRRLKEDLILTALNANGYFPDPFSWRRNCLEVDREAPVAQCGADLTTARRIASYQLQGPLVTCPYNQAGDYDIVAPVTDIPDRRTIEFTLVSAFNHFEVESEGWTSDAAGARLSHARLEGALELGGQIVLTGQRDFEGTADGSAWDMAGGAVRVSGSAERRDPWGIPTTQTHPRFPLSSYTADSVNMGNSATPAMIEAYAYPRALGDLRLASWQWDLLELANASFTVPFNEDLPNSVPGKTRYNANDWTDNLGDPLVRGVPDAPRPANHGWQDPPNGWETFHKGIAYSPCGPRCTPPASMPSALPTNCLRFKWDPAAGTRSFPMIRDTVGGIPAAGEITQGTIECWIPARGGEDIAPGFPYLDPKIQLWHPSGGSWRCFLEVSFGRSQSGSATFDEVRVWTLSPGGPTPIDATWPARAAWRHVALVFEDDGVPSNRGGLLDVYLDGTKFYDDLKIYLDASFTPAASDSGKAMLTLVRFPADDLFLYPTSLDKDAIMGHAQQHRHVKDGDYHSPRLVLDAGRFPRGASLRGAAWDAFLPDSTGGSFVFEVVGKNGSGTEIARTRTVWDETETLERASFSPSLASGCRELTLEVEIHTDQSRNPDLWVEVDDVKVLRDTPVLDEFSILYSAGPRWISWGER